MAEPDGLPPATSTSLGGGGGGSPALIRLAFVGSVPRVMLTDIPGCRSASFARCPFTVISVNWVIANVFITLSSRIVIESALTLEMTVGRCWGSLGFFPASAGADVRMRQRAESAQSWRVNLFIGLG